MKEPPNNFLKTQGRKRYPNKLMKINELSYFCYSHMIQMELAEVFGCRAVRDLVRATGEGVKAADLICKSAGLPRAQDRSADLQNRRYARSYANLRYKAV